MNGAVHETWRCRSCDAALAIVQRPRGLCDDRRREASIGAALTKAERAWPDLGRRPVALLPQLRRPLVPLSEARRASFASHLDGILEQAAAEWTPLLPPRAETPAPTNGLGDDDAGLPVLASACAFCGGQCCEAGGDRAWLEVATVQRILPGEAEPDFDGLRAVWLAHLPAEVFEDSCVFHAERGCALPRELRSSICNQFACAGLAELAPLWKRSGGRCLVATNGGPGSRVGRVDGDTIGEPATDDPANPAAWPADAARRRHDARRLPLVTSGVSTLPRHSRPGRLGPAGGGLPVPDPPQSRAEGDTGCNPLCNPSNESVSGL
jgi:hypothetical protein